MFTADICSLQKSNVLQKVTLKHTGSALAASVNELMSN